MPSFADLEERVNAAAIGRLANATAIWNDEIAVAGIFDAAYVNPFNAIDDVAPVFRCKAADVVGIATGDTLGIGQQAYGVRGVERDDPGLLLLRLQKR